MDQKVKKSWREASRGNWQSDKENISHDHINSGSFMRMADSLETIAKDRTNLERDVQYWKDSSKRKAEEVTLLTNKVRGYKGRITSLLGEIAKIKKGNNS